MGHTYGDAWIDLLYDYDTEVRETSPSEEIMKLHGIRPKKYLVYPGTEKVVLEDFVIGKPLINYEPKTIIKAGLFDSKYPIYDKKELEKCNAGDIYTVTLIQRILHINKELDQKRIHRIDAANQLTFEPGELEQKLATAKKDFLTTLNHYGLNAQEEKIYCRLVGFNPHF